MSYIAVMIEENIRQAREQEYKELLKNAPAQDSDEFLEYLKQHNEVVHECSNWLIIKNFKYDSPERPWYTAFKKSTRSNYGCIERTNPDWQWIKKAKGKQTVPNRFHIHLTP